MAYHSKISKEICKSICKAVARGTPRTHAAKAAGITLGTLSAWTKRGEDDIRDGLDTVYSALALDIEVAHGKSVDVRIRRISEAAKGGQVIKRTVTIDKHGNERVDVSYSQPKWQADAWYLDRREHDHFATKKTIEHTGEIKRVNVNLVKHLGDLDAILLSFAVQTPKLIEEIPNTINKENKDNTKEQD